MDLTPTPSQTAGPFLHLGLTDRRSVSLCRRRRSQGRTSMAHLSCAGWGGRAGSGRDDRTLAGRLRRELSATAMARRSPQVSVASEDWRRRKMDRAPLKPSGRDACRVRGKLQAPHINVSVFARRPAEATIHTQFISAGDPANRQDPVLALVPESRHATLLARPDPARAGGWRFEIRMRGENETVFFDV